MSPKKNWIEGDPENNAGTGGAPYTAAPTFAALQAAGAARPPAPTAMSASGSIPASSIPRSSPDPSVQNGGAAVVPAYAGPRAPTTGSDTGPTTLPYTQSPAGVPTGTPTPASGTTTAAPGSIPGESNFEKQLRERYQSRNTAPQFTGPNGQTAATFMPGANPFAPTPAASGNGLNPSILKNVQDLLQNPSGYSTDAATSTYNRLGGAIDDQFNVSNQKINEEMARRGLPVSTLAGGRLFDSNVARKSAKEQLAGGILTDQAYTQGADRRGAIASAGGLSAEEFNQALSEFTANQGANAQTFGQTETKLNDYLGFGQQGFSNQLATQNQNNAQQQQMIDMLMRMFGGTQPTTTS